AALSGQPFRHRVLERGRRAPARPRLPAVVRLRALPRVAPRVRHDPEPVVPDRHAHAGAARALALRYASRRGLPPPGPHRRARPAPAYAARTARAFSPDGPAPA